jgi:hypothetical protein
MAHPLREKGPNTLFFRRSSLLVCLLLTLCSAVSSVTAQSGAPPAFDPLNGHWYQVVRVSSNLPWADADSAATTMFYAGYRGHLATVTSAAEDMFVVSTIAASGSSDPVWLGGYQDTSAPDYREPDRGWRWVTGEPWNYTAWNGGEPNNAGGSENHLESYSNGAWNDAELAATDAYLVEYEPAPVPGPPRLAILPNPVTGGMTTVGQVTLDRPAAPDDITVSLGSSDPTVAAAPAVVIVPAGMTTALF